MTNLQKLALDAVDQLGSMTLHELETACWIALRPLFNQKLLLVSADAVHVTRNGVHAIEEENRKIDASEFAACPAAGGRRE